MILLRDELENIQGKYQGIQDIDISDNYEDLMNKINQIKESFKLLTPHEVDTHFFPSSTNTNTLNIKLEENEYITSIKSDKINKIKEISLCIGGSEIDRMYGEMIPVLQKMFNFEENEIPFLLMKNFINGGTYSDIKINIYYNEIGVSDILTFKYYKAELTNEFIMPILQCQFNVPELKGSKFKLAYFNHCSPYLFIKNNFNTDPIININGDKYLLEHYGIIDNYRIYDLSKDNGGYPISINFSKIDTVELIFNEEIPEGIFYSLCLNFLIKKSGMTGLKYSS